MGDRPARGGAVAGHPVELLKLRIIAAIIAAAAGIGSFAALSSLPPGSGTGRPAELAGLVFGSPWFRGAFVVAAPVLLLSALWIAQRARRLGHAVAARTGSVEPLLWGAAAPLLSVLLDPWFFHTTVFIVALAGIALGALRSLRRGAPRGAPSSQDSRRALAVLVAGAVLIPTFLVLPGPPWFHPLSGDEPHYLVTARSLWTDGDVNVADEYEEGAWQPFWSGELSPHAKPGADPNDSYPIHGSGLSLWLAPWYGIGQGLTEGGFNILVRIAMSLWLAAAAVALFFLLRDIAGARSAAYGAAASIFTLPLLFAGPHLFPAVPVFALSCGAYAILRRAPGPLPALLAGMLLAGLPWLHFKFFGLMAAVAAAGCWWIWSASDPRRRKISIAALAAPLVVTGLGHVAFTWQLYGRLSPLAIHVGADPALRATAEGDNWIAYVTDPIGAVATALGYFLDQREGLLFYAPHYLLAAAGFAWLWHKRRHDAIALVLIAAALIGPYALSQETGHWAPPARPLTGVLWTLAVPMGIGVVLPAGRAATGRARAALRGVLLAAGACATVTMLLQADLLYHDHNVSRSLVLLRYGAPELPLWRMAPLWLGPEAVRWGPSLSWLVVAAAAGAFLWRWGWDLGSATSTHGGSGEGSAGEPQAAESASEQAAVEQRDPDGADPAEETARRTGRRAAAGFIVVASVLMLWHHARVPLTDLHQPWGFGAIRVWKPQSPPTRAWANERGVWTGGHDSVRLLVSSRRPIETIVFDLGVLAPMQTEVQLGRDRQTLRMTPEQRSLARFTPGPGARWNGEYFYHLNVVARAGVSRAALGIDNDARGLGLFLELVQLEAVRRP